MSDKVFIPKNVGMTKQQIWEMFYDPNRYDGNKHYCEVSNQYDSIDEFEIPRFTADEIPDEIAQDFVNEIYDLRDENFGEEEFVDERKDVARRYYLRICNKLER